VRDHLLGKSAEECVLRYRPLRGDVPSVYVQLKSGTFESTSGFSESAPLDRTVEQVSEDLISFQLDLRCTGHRGDTPYGDRQVREYLDSLRSDNRYLVEDAWGVLSTWGPRAVPLLVAALKSNDTRMRTRVARIMKEFGPTARDAIPELERAAADPDSELAKAAQDALLRIKR
jgi:hypothetical protein